MNRVIRPILFALVLTFLVSTFASTTLARGSEYDAVCDFIEENYRAKKVKIPFMWLARAVVGVVRPAGVKALKVTIYRKLKFDDTFRLNEEMRGVMRDSFGPEWSPLLRSRSKTGEHLYMNMREKGKNIKVLLVSIQKDEAVVVRATFNPDKLVKFLENPRIFGISLSERKAKSDSETEESVEEEKPKQLPENTDVVEEDN